MKKMVFAFLLLASTATAGEWTQRQKDIIGQMVQPKAGGFSIQILGGTATPPFLSVTGTLPASPGAAVTGTLHDITGAGSAAQQQTAGQVNLEAGYTGSSQTQGLVVNNFSQSTGVNIGARFEAVPASVASGSSQIGVYGHAGFAADPGGYDIGGFFQANVGAGINAASLGVIGNASSGSRRIGGFFSINTSTAPTLSGSGSAGMMSDVGGLTGSPNYAWQSGSIRIGEIDGNGGFWLTNDGAPHTLTEGVATDFVILPVPVNGRTGGTIQYCVDADDGTEFQVRCGTIPWALANKSNAEVCAVGTASDAVAATSGTLTVAFTTDVSTTNRCTIQANATSSLAQTTLRINYHVELYGSTNTGSIPQP
jgi:hypothetical protein